MQEHPKAYPEFPYRSLFHVAPTHPLYRGTDKYFDSFIIKGLDNQNTFEVRFNQKYGINVIDEYLVKERSYKRLKEEFEAHKKLIIAYDLDSTVFDYHKKGASYEMVKDLIRKYKNYAYFIVFTSSEPDRYNEIKLILQKENLPYDSINDDAPFIPFKGRKVYYNILLDDRAGLNQTYNELLRLYNEVIINLK